MPPAARLTDFHQCPMVTPGVPPVPHVGGPIVGPGMPTVLIARLGDQTAHGGQIMMGAFNVLIGG